jgi:cytidyltransferase-like protein
MSSIQRYLLSSIYCNNLNDDCNIKQTIPYLSEKMGFDASSFRDIVFGLEKEGLITTNFGPTELIIPDNNDKIHRLTDLGRSKIRVVLVGGVFDLLHSGHIHTLKTAKALGDVLVTVVATDTTVSSVKKNRKIYHDEKSRLELVSSIHFVDKAIIGRKRSIYETVEFVKPDIIALGYDQFHDEKTMKKNCLERGIKLEVVRLSSPVPQLKSSVIKSELGTSFYDL